MAAGQRAVGEGSASRAMGAEAGVGAETATPSLVRLPEGVTESSSSGPISRARSAGASLVPSPLRSFVVPLRRTDGTVLPGSVEFDVIAIGRHATAVKSVGRTANGRRPTECAFSRFSLSVLHRTHSIPRSEDVEEGGDIERIADLTAKVAALERQLKSHPTTDNNLPPSAPARLSSRNSSSTPPSGFNLGSDNSLASISSTMQLVWGTNMRLSPQEHETLRAFLMGHAVSNAQVGRGSVAWQLGEKGLVFALTRHLLDGAFFPPLHFFSYS